ncbi:MAG TPA: protein kinase [Polyangiaceae bacterium]|nr:protein kinase [Polyangiaceae bacterium]
MSEYEEFRDGEIVAGTRYRVVRLLGVGGMGSVYEVEHVELGKRFVLKALLRSLARRHDLVLRLRNEWRALGRLEHPNIVTVTDAGTSAGGAPFYVMERLDGETLEARMRRVRRFSVSESLAVAQGVLEGLAAAHAIGVVHRDIKPPNVFLVGGEHPKILDFGVAKISDDPGVVTARGAAVGTPRYMSPEQVRGEAVDGRADVYATGLLLFEMLTGVNPFEDAREPNQLLLAQLGRPAPRVASLTMGVPSELDELVASMLEKSPENRPRSALDAARALGELRARWPEIEAARRAAVASGAREVIAIVPLATQRQSEESTQPDGVAGRTRSSDATGRSPSGAPSPRSGSTVPAAPQFEPSVPSVRLLNSPVPPRTATPPLVPSSSGPSLEAPGVPTEVLEPTPAPPTRTRVELGGVERAEEARRSPSIPPIAASGEFEIPRTGGGRWAIGGVILAVSLVFVGFAAVVSARNSDRHATPPAPPAPARAAPIATQPPQAAERVAEESRPETFTPERVLARPKAPEARESRSRARSTEREAASERRVERPRRKRPRATADSTAEGQKNGEVASKRARAPVPASESKESSARPALPGSGL